MKVLWQVWIPSKGGELHSLSKDHEQLLATIQEVAPRNDPEDEDNVLNNEEAATPDGDPDEIEIPDSSAFAEMVEKRTVFLLDDEMDVVFDNLPDRD